MARPWEADPSAGFNRRLGLEESEAGPEIPDIWEMDNGDAGFIGRDVTEEYRDKLPEGVSIGADERLVIIPMDILINAKQDIPDA